MENELPKEHTHYELDYVNIVLFLFVIIGIALTASFLITGRVHSEQAITEEPKPREEVVHVDPFATIALLANAAYVFDVKNQTALFAYNEELQLPLASLTKLMTALAAESYILPEETITIDFEALDTEGDSGLFAFEEWRAKDLLDFMLIVSSNDGANAVASVAGGAKVIRSGNKDTTPEQAFITEMNTRAQALGLRQTYFINETGLDPNTALSGGYGSAKDASKLLEYIIVHKPALIAATTFPMVEFTSRSNITHTATNTNEIIGSIPGLIASKTGFTDLAGGNLVIAFDAGINRPIIITILGSTIDGRFEDVSLLVQASLNAIAH